MWTYTNIHLHEENLDLIGDSENWEQEVQGNKLSYSYKNSGKRGRLLPNSRQSNKETN